MTHAQYGESGGGEEGVRRRRGGGGGEGADVRVVLLLMINMFNNANELSAKLFNNIDLGKDLALRK